MPRRILVVVAAVLALSVPGDRAEAQLKVGLHATRAADLFDGANGAGLSVQLGVPLFPVGVMVAGDYFFPDCGPNDDCSYMSGSADVQFSVPSLVIQPYALAGITVRRVDRGTGSGQHDHSGLVVGAGLNLGAVIVGGYAEARWEFIDPDNQLVMRVGFRF